MMSCKSPDNNSYIVHSNGDFTSLILNTSHLFTQKCGNSTINYCSCFLSAHTANVTIRYFSVVTHDIVVVLFYCVFSKVFHVHYIPHAVMFLSVLFIV